ncbi:MAG TPA: hypothetical protein VNK95_08085, partial [Caldilineaceae bacterium]|nr:hypothetical protein [Caldilineaceae bacterium]
MEPVPVGPVIHWPDLPPVALPLRRCARGSTSGEARVYSSYFNHVSRVAEGWWDRRDFLHRWWRLYAGDRRWTPPHYGSLYRALVSERAPHVARQHPALIYVEALYGRSRRNGEAGSSFSTALMEEPVAATVLLADPRRRDDTATLGLLATANDEESLDRL